MGDLVERLLKYAPWVTKPTVAEIMAEAADAIEALTAERDRLKAALDEIANHPLATKPTDLAGWREFSKMLRRIARAALATQENTDGQ